MQRIRSVTGDAGISKAYQVLKGVMAGWINDYNVNGKICRVVFLFVCLCVRVCVCVLLLRVFMCVYTCVCK